MKESRKNFTFEKRKSENILIKMVDNFSINKLIIAVLLFCFICFCVLCKLAVEILQFHFGINKILTYNLGSFSFHVMLVEVTVCDEILVIF